MSEPVRIFHIIGRKNNGKTTLMLELIEEFCSMGYKVGSIKHTGCEHELDTRGKDSYRHRKTGAEPASIISKDMTGIFFSSDITKDPYERILPLYQNCDIILVEGDKTGSGTKLEVYRNLDNANKKPLALEEDSELNVTAIITDEHIDCELQIWPRNDIKFIANKLLAE